VIEALVADILTPLIAAIFGKPNFASLSFTIHSSHYLYGDFLNAVFSFVTIAAVVFFFAVKPMNFLIERSRREPPVDPTTQKCPECLSEVPLAAKRCAFCTVAIAA